MKLHLLLDDDGYVPSFAVVTEGKISEIKVARTLRFAPGTILAIDRGYVDYQWFRELTQKEVYLVTRKKEKTVYEVKEESAAAAKQQRGTRPIIGFPRLAREGEGKIKTFVGTSANAVRTQVCAALIAMLVGGVKSFV